MSETVITRSISQEQAVDFVYRGVLPHKHNFWVGATTPKYVHFVCRICKRKASVARYLWTAMLTTHPRALSHTMQMGVYPR